MDSYRTLLRIGPLSYVAGTTSKEFHMQALQLIDDWPVEKAAAGWTDQSGAEHVHGNANTAFELASITKALFSYAILVAVEEGTLDLNSKVVDNGATIGHLLSHSSGMAARGKGAQAQVIVTDPGTKRIYSNQGFDLLARELEAAASMQASLYFAEAVAGPLGLSSTAIYGSVAYQAMSTVSDLLAFGRELLSPTLVSSQTLDKATSPHLPALTGVLPGFGSQEPNSWGLGFEVRGTKKPHWTAPNNSPQTFGHFGQAGTFIWVDPMIGECCVALTNTDFGDWSIEHWPKFSQAVVDEPN